MKKIESNLFVATASEIRKSNSSDFESGTTIYVSNNSGDHKYIITLEKGNFSSFALKSTVECANTYNYLTTAGTSKGCRPYYIHDFLAR